jgi:1,4-alpha-glucan branching enzyme
LDKKREIETNEKGSLVDFAGSYKTMGLHKVPGGIKYVEWAPSASGLNLFGDFNGWDKNSHALTNIGYGKWEIFLPDVEGVPAIPHNSRLKVCIKTPDGRWLDRIPPWITYVRQEAGNPIYDGVFWNPEVKYALTHARPPKPSRLRIYESHVGMASEEPCIGTYKNFKDKILPYIVDLGYNAIQLMAIMEHAYYASFGYQVTNFFAASSRYGTPEELKELIDEAHRLGLVVLLDVVHSHASKNVADGLNEFDGTDHCYFHAGARGEHSMWDSRLFNYNQYEVLRFLLSNLRFWVEEYGFDGFRFDGVTSMVYYSHGLGSTPMTYEEHFGGGVDDEAMLYLKLANAMLRELLPSVITIAEEVSGLATMCRPIEYGGVGFDYRLGMGLPDKWIELMKVKDEDWNMGNIAFTLTNRRWKEATIAYVESHDQALVGDKTVAFWLMDKEMYTDMTILKERSPIIDRGLALHKMLRFITLCLGGEAYLTFMGNEFGHPEWIDFPRPGNNWSYHHARRRFDLVRDHLLRYKSLHAFDRAMNHFEEKYSIMTRDTFVSLKNEGDKVIVFERGDLVFVFNFHPSSSFTDYKIGVQHPGKYSIALDTDWSEFEGSDRNARDTVFFTKPDPWNDRPHSMQVYIPSRTGIAFVRLD